MKIKTFAATAPKLARLQDLSVVIQTGTRGQIRAKLAEVAADPMFRSNGWRANFAKLALVFASGLPEYSIFALGGNSKLPFVAFSTLPGVTCPGAGECIEFCYSFRAHRYPAAYARQAQNAFLMRFGRETIRTAFAQIAAQRPDGFDFRLYVDGDFSSAADLVFWMDTLAAHPAARAYGYSKSFALLADYAGAWPGNYQLNLSSGHNADPELFERVKALPIVRGEFRAVSIGRKVRNTDHGTHANNAAIRAALPNLKIFPCPGKCGSCTGKGHACGMPALHGRVIAIAIH